MSSDSDRDRFDRDRVVKSDMERIFRPAAGRFRARMPVSPAAGRDGDDRPRARGGMRWVTLAAPVLVVMSVGAFAVRQGTTLWRAERPAPAASAEPRPQAAAPLTAAATASTPAPVPVSVPAPASSPGPDPAPRATSSVERPVEAAAKKAAEKKAIRRDRALAARGDRSRPRPRSSAAARTACPPGSRSDFCIYRDVTSADRRLRAAYARATRDGVRTKELAAIRKRWVRARRVSLDKPHETIRRYHGLANELDYMRRGGRR